MYSAALSRSASLNAAVCCTEGICARPACRPARAPGCGLHGYIESIKLDRTRTVGLKMVDATSNTYKAPWPMPSGIIGGPSDGCSSRDDRPSSSATAPSAPLDASTQPHRAFFHAQCRLCELLSRVC